MAALPQQKTGLTGNMLKIIAMVTMTLDHVGLQLLPQYPILRILGRIAMPLYAFLIAEGCRHTRSRGRYLGRLTGLALVCQVVYFFAMGSLYQCILVTFSLSVCLIHTMEQAAQRRTAGAVCAALGALTGAWFVCVVLPRLLPGTDFGVDYGFFGVLLPVFAYFGNPRWLALVLGTALLGLEYGGAQWFALTAVPLVTLYNGQRGKGNLGRFFYFYYPAHLVVIYLLSLFV